MNLTPEQLQFIETQLQLQLDLRLQASWSSHHKNYREAIHQDIKLFQGLSEFDYLNPDFSIAHCALVGGYLSKKKYSPGQIGFDLEEVARVRPELAKRICKTESEFLLAPSPAHLWVAKEASYKAFRGPTQPKTITSVEVTQWRILRNGTFMFEALNHDNNHANPFKGLSLQIADLAYGFVHFVPV